MNYTMGKLFFLSVFCIFTLCVSGQKRLSERQTMGKSHIDFTKEYVYFKISGLIEINGHTFKNDTSKTPIFFQANLDGIAICDTINHIKYEHRICGEKGCGIIHLTPIRSNTIFSPIWQNGSISTTPGILYNTFP